MKTLIMSGDPLLGSIGMFGGNFPVRGWAYCDGQLLAISQYSALFSLLGTIYGGDGRTTFGLPDLRGRVAIHPGNGPGLPAYSLGEKGGNYQTILSVSNLPAHNHSVSTPLSDQNGTSAQAVNRYLAKNVVDDDGSGTQGDFVYGDTTDNSKHLASYNTNNTGANVAFSNMPPFLCIHYEIALTGLFPSRN